MRCINQKLRPPRQTVLIVSHPDGYLETFAERHVDIHVARIPQSFSGEGERQAEDVVEMMLPKRYREVFRADRLRATSSTQPLLPSVLSESLVVCDSLTAMNEMAGAAQQQDEEVMTWTL